MNAASRRRRGAVIVLVVCALSAAARSADAQVVRLEITAREPLDNGRAFGAAGAYELIRGRAHGEVDPSDRRNRIIQDIDLAPRNARGRVEYVATFALTRPVAPARSSGVLIYSVVNRGNGDVEGSPDGHISVVSGWQGDLVPTARNQTIAVPVARYADGSSITGPVLSRWVDVANGTMTVPLRNGTGYPHAAADQSRAMLTMASAETVAGEKRGTIVVPRERWRFADCRTEPFPGEPDPTRLCLQDGFQADRLYELVYTARDPLVLGIGLAAVRDLMSFLRHETRDAAGTPNPVGGAVSHVVAVGNSQSGNFIKTFIHLGFNEDLSGRSVWDGAFPRIAARQTSVRRYYYPGTTHGGGGGGFSASPSGLASGCALPSNPNPQREQTRALTAALVAWVVNGTPPPDSRYPLLGRGDLVPATAASTGFPSVPGAPSIDGLVKPVLDYDFGPDFRADDVSGVITRQPPRIVSVLPTYVPRVDSDGNETTGVPSVLHQAPLGTYLGWNVAARGFFKGQICGFQGGYIPFAATAAERVAAGDPRPSLEERYGALEGYVCVVRRAAVRAVAERFLLQDDADRIIAEAERSQVLPVLASSPATARERAVSLCAATAN
jgi:hypothetical protein